MPSEAPGSPRPSAPLKLVYVLGSYRSGTTVLGALLGAAPGIRTAGEMQALPAAFWENRQRCSCGEPIAQCPFWTDVRQYAETRVDLHALRAGQRRFETYHGTLRDFGRGLFARREFRRHVERVAAFTEAVAGRTGHRILVDLSKNPIRGYVRRFLPRSRIDVYYLHVVRDGRAVMYSRTWRPGGGRIRPLMQGPAAMTARWIIVNLASSYLCGGRPDRYLRLQYEELVAHPRATLERIGRFLGTDLSPVIDLLERGEAVPLDHLVAANLRLRKAPELVLRSDDAWRTELPRSSARTFRWIGGWLARHYGYRDPS